MKSIEPIRRLLMTALIAASCSTFAVTRLSLAQAAGATTRDAQAAEAMKAAQEQIDAEKYSDALATIAQALPTLARERDEVRPERYQLLMLRGEALLRSGERSAATSAFQLAARSAPSPRAASVARANGLLCYHSQGREYKPRTSGGEPVNILTVESRKKAFAALREDLLKAIQPDLDKAADLKVLAPILDLLPTAMELGFLEVAATGSADQTHELLWKLEIYARLLSLSEIQHARYRIDRLEDMLGSLANGADKSGIGRRGVQGADRKTLQDDLSSLRKIGRSARDGRHRAMDLPRFDGAKWEVIIAEAADQIDRAEAILDIGG